MVHGSNDWALALFGHDDFSDSPVWGFRVVLLIALDQKGLLPYETVVEDFGGGGASAHALLL